MKQYNFVPESPWQYWVTLCREIDSEREGFDPVEAHCPAAVWARGLGEMTLVDAIQGPCRDAMGARCWAWALTVAWDYLPQILLPDVMRVIACDPPTASKAYEDLHDKLDIECKIILWDSFSGVMPRVRERLTSELGKPY